MFGSRHSRLRFNFSMDFHLETEEIRIYGSRNDQILEGFKKYFKLSLVGLFNRDSIQIQRYIEIIYGRLTLSKQWRFGIILSPPDTTLYGQLTMQQFPSTKTLQLIKSLGKLKRHQPERLMFLRKYLKMKIKRASNISYIMVFFYR